MYHIAVCDDSAVDCTHLKEYIYKNAENRESLRLHEYASGEELLEAMRNIRFSLIFLDIQMEGMDGAETARKLRRMDDDVILVFYTGKVDPSPASFEVQPYRYIKKNMPEAEKNEYIRSSLKRMEEVEKAPVLTAKWLGNRAFIKPGEIVYIEKCKKTTRVFLSKSAREKYGICDDTVEIRIADKLENLYEILKFHGFGYPHDSYIINFKYLIFCTSKDLKLEGYEYISFKITRSKAQDFNSLKSKFMNKKYKRGTEK